MGFVKKVGAIMKVMEIRDEWDFAGIGLGDRPDPEPGPQEVLLEMKAASINYRDFLMVRRGYGRYSGDLPLVPLSDGVGTVVAVGEDVSRVAVGDRVCPCFNQRWRNGPFRDDYWFGLLGGPLDGVMQEKMLVDQEGVVKAPEHLTDVEAATLACAGVTAWNAVIEAANLTAGDTLLVQGTGGVSLFALQIGKMIGADVIATTSSGEKAEKLKALGARHVIDYVETPEWGKAVLGLTDGRGVDAVVEVGGAGTLQQSVRAVRANGTISLVGNLSGSMTEVNLPLVFMKCARLIGIAVGHRDSFEAFSRAMATTGMRPVVDDQVYGFEDLRPALEALPEGRHFGKVAISF